MAYAYWKAGRVEDIAVFDLFFRKNPFGGEFTVFAGLTECLEFLKRFKYSDCGKLILLCVTFPGKMLYLIRLKILKKSIFLLYKLIIFVFVSDIEYLRKALPSNVEEEFFTYMKQLTPKDVTIYAIKEGSVAFPR